MVFDSRHKHGISISSLGPTLIYRHKVPKSKELQKELMLKAAIKREMRASKLQHNHHKGELLNYYNA